jgi:hypothetical protein
MVFAGDPWAAGSLNVTYRRLAVKVFTAATLWGVLAAVLSSGWRPRSI